MKRYILLIIIASLSFSSCALFKDKITVNELVIEKDKIDKADNPALKFLIKNDLSEKNIVLKNVLVKDITESNNIDYEFCVITDIVSQKGSIEFYIYTKNINIISRLVKGKTRINAEGNFYRFFSILDKYYTKVEVTNSSIDIIEKEK